MQRSLTQGSVLKNLIRFSLPYLFSCFLQTFYGLTDLFIIGQFNGSDAITAVSVGSQVTHMLTVIIVGLVMGTTVAIGHSVGEGKNEKVSRLIGNTVTLFTIFSVVAAVLLIWGLNGIVSVVSTPAEAVEQTSKYLFICFIGVPFIVAYNVISGIFRGMGDSKTPMYFVAAAGVVNIILDYILIGGCKMGAEGAALATVAAQTASVLLALIAIFRMKLGIRIRRQDFLLAGENVSAILRVGIPVAAQDGMIQISFLAITAIANSRGLDVAAAVGIVEKLISFFFLVPSAMLASVSAIAAQNAGAGKHEQGRKVLQYGIGICVTFGLAAALFCQFGAEGLVGLFAREEPEVVRLGSQYLRAYVFDCAVAGVHFCFSGYFCAYGKAIFSFVHNLASILLVRVPGAYLASRFFPDTLYPMGWAAPAGSMLSVLICIGLFLWWRGGKAVEKMESSAYY